MFNNIGGKIKVLAQVACWVGIICSVIFGFIYGHEADSFLIGLLIIVLGSLTAWTSSFALYGFGEMINQLECLNSNSKRIFDLLKERNTVVPADAVKNQTVEKTREPQKFEHKWVCYSCGKWIDKSPCPHCGNE